MQVTVREVHRLLLRLGTRWCRVVIVQIPQGEPRHLQRVQGGRGAWWRRGPLPRGRRRRTAKLLVEQLDVLDHTGFEL